MDKKWCCQEFESHATVIPSEDGFRAVLVGAKLISSRYSSSDRQTNRPLIPRKAEWKSGSALGADGIWNNTTPRSKSRFPA